MKKVINTPTVSIYFDTVDGHYLVQPTVPSPLGGSRESGKPVPIREQDFDSSIAEVVLDYLQRYLNTKHDPTLERRRSEKQQLDFVKRHKWVSVARLASGEVQVSAGERQGGGYHGVRDGDLILNASSVRENLPQALREAFHKAK
jgi:hypothetical protein